MSPIDSTRRHHSVALLVVAIIATTALYWIGLHGPFLLDDASNLSSLPIWNEGKLGLGRVLFERGAGAFGRPLSMASFALNVWAGGYSPFALKLGNLLVHLASGMVMFALLRRLLARDPGLASRAHWYAAIVCTLWLLHPLHVSTVLYVVQRMAQMSTLVILLGLWLYVTLRERIERGHVTAPAAGLLLGLPAMTALAVLAKENGALLPLLCTVIELAFFGAKRRPSVVRIFLGLYVAAPVLLVAAAFALWPERFLENYLGRDFTVEERVLSQGRVLWDYLGKLIVPNTPSMGVYADDFVVSTGLWSPPTTLLSMLGLLAISAAAVGVRKRMPAVFFGWFFFLVAHAIEASPLPLELYFEHRNYLPSMGILVSCVAIAVAAGQWLRGRNFQVDRIGYVLLSGAILVLAIGTHGRAQVWQSEILIAESSLRAHPQSLRANALVLASAIQREDQKRTSEVLKNLVTSPMQRNRSMGHLFKLYADCVLTHRADPRDLEAFVTLTPMPVTIPEAQPFDQIYSMTLEKPCAGITDTMFGTALARLADRAVNEGRQSPHLRLRYQSASFFVRAGDWQSALPQAKLAWVPTSKPYIAIPLVLAQLSTGDQGGAEETLRSARLQADPTNANEASLLQWLQKQVDAAGKNTPRRPEPQS